MLHNSSEIIASRLRGIVQTAAFNAALAASLALIYNFLGLRALLQKGGRPIKLLLGQQQQAFLLDDIRVGLVDRLLRLQDRGLRLLE